MTTQHVECSTSYSQNDEKNFYDMHHAFMWKQNITLWKVLILMFMLICLNGCYNTGHVFQILKFNYEYYYLAAMFKIKSRDEL